MLGCGGFSKSEKAFRTSSFIKTTKAQIKQFKGRINRLRAVAEGKEYIEDKDGNPSDGLDDAAKDE